MCVCSGSRSQRFAVDVENVRPLCRRDVSVAGPHEVCTVSGVELLVSVDHARAAVGRDPLRVPAESHVVAGREGHAPSRIRRGGRGRGVRVLEEAPESAALQMRQGESSDVGVFVYSV